MADEKRGPFEQLGESVGEAAGRVAGRMTDLGMDVAGSLFGNAVAALGDWWGSPEARDAERSFGEREPDARRHHETSGADRPYDEVRPLYRLGHVAAHNPDYAGRSFRDVEPQLERAWNESEAKRQGDWTRVRPYVGHGFESRAETLRQTREAGLRAQGGGTSDPGSIRRSAGDPLM
jgi:hypothetical protein